MRNYLLALCLVPLINCTAEPTCYPHEARYTARYYNRTLPWGTQVELHSGPRTPR